MKLLKAAADIEVPAADALAVVPGVLVKLLYGEEQPAVLVYLLCGSTEKFGASDS